jgi:hypothetical protein
MLQFDYLHDETKLFVHLIDCEVKEDYETKSNKLVCGWAWFKGGISGTIDLCDEGVRVAEMRIPKEVSQNATFLVLYSVDYLEFEILSLTLL